MSVVIETTIGDITVDLFVDERPISCLNFIKLCKLKYYNYNLFHTIERGFIAQTGDPTGAGNGGTSIWGILEGNEKRFFEGETLPKIYHTTTGLLSLVSAGKNLVGSQFFFTLAPNLTSLDSMHCVIGEVVEGHETLRMLNEAIVDEEFRPYQDIRITHTVILEDPFPDPRSFRVPSRSPSPSAQRLLNGRIAADEDIDDTDGKTAEELQEMLAQREAKARATILEIVGDLPDAEMAPPENVLFVCKLNPLTTDDDLEIIFSRFGKVKSCEVIRDKKSGDSLQYAFVEFEEQKSCEAAYFKMDNVLIDDRRIHVDFSQSVAKVKWRGKGRGVEGSLKNSEFDNIRDRRGVKGNREHEHEQPHRNREREYSNRDRPHSNRQTDKRMGSAERRLAREERHREQREKLRDERHREHRAPDREYAKRHKGRTEYERHDSGNKRREERSDFTCRVERNKRERRSSHERHRRSRSRDQERTRRSSQERQHATRTRRSPYERQRSAERMGRSSQERHGNTERMTRSSQERQRDVERQKRSPIDELRKRRFTPDRRHKDSRCATEKRHERKDDERRNGHQSAEKSRNTESKEKIKSKTKKRRARTRSSSSCSSSSSSESESDSSDAASSSSSTNDTSASSDSSAEQKRRKQKRAAAKKKSRSKTHKSKSKKHK